MSESVLVKGFCPMGCGETLFIGEDGFITCSWIGCPNRSAVSIILSDPETEHVVEFTDEGFTILHPLRERLNEVLLDCRLTEDCRHMSGPPDPIGKYRAILVGSPGQHVRDSSECEWNFTLIARAIF